VFIHLLRIFGIIAIIVHGFFSFPAASRRAAFFCALKRKPVSAEQSPLIDIKRRRNP
jgi:hypothetical protein